MLILCTKRWVQMRWMYLNRSVRKLELLWSIPLFKMIDLRWNMPMLRSKLKKLWAIEYFWVLLHVVKLRNIQLLITSLILIITWACCTSNRLYWWEESNWIRIFTFDLPSSHNYSKWWKIAHYGFQFFSHHFYMLILYMKRWVQMWWIYLNRSVRKLEWEHAVKLRNIQLLITSLILIVT